VNCSFSVDWAIKERERAATSATPETVWADADDADGGALAEITHVLPARALHDYSFEHR
jgi:hypothetical protein